MTIIIDPTGGGDFETIQAYEDVAVDAQDVVCRGGGDLGALTLNNANMAGVVISVEGGHQHDGTLASIANSARTTGTWSATIGCTIRGIAFDGGAIVCTASDVAIEDCLLNHAGASSAIFLRATNATLTGLAIRRCVAYASGSSSTIPIFAIGTIATSGDFAATGVIEDCTVRRLAAGTAVNGLGGRAQAGSGRTATVNVTISNCAVFDFDNDIVEQQAGAGGTETINGTHANNASSDGTADDFGGSGHLVNQSAAAWFENAASNLRMRPAAPGQRAGIKLAGVVTDFQGTRRSDPPDIGFHQVTPWHYGDRFATGLAAILAGRRRRRS